MIFWRGIRAAVLVPDEFGRYLALGITLALGIQAFMNMSVVLGMGPTKGIPLPMISYGGTSLLSTLASHRGPVERFGARGMTVTVLGGQPTSAGRHNSEPRLPGTARCMMAVFCMAGGGTGGHVIPALAVARELRARGHEVYFVGTERGVEHRMVPAENFPIEYVAARRT